MWNISICFTANGNDNFTDYRFFRFRPSHTVTFETDKILKQHEASRGISVSAFCTKVKLTRSIGTVHTSAKACLTSAAIWQTSMSSRFMSTSRISQWWQIRKTIPVSRQWSGLPPKFNRLFTGPLPTFPGNFMQTVRKFLRKLPRDKQTNKQRRLHILLGGGNYIFFV